MTRATLWWLVATGLLIGAAACTDASDLERRIDELEAKVEQLRWELAARPEIDDLIVVGKELNLIESGVSVEVCVRYRAFDGDQETCIPAVEDSTELANRCLREATVGLPLPEACR